VHDGLGFLEVGDRERAPKPADPALFEAALGEAVVDRRPRVRPDRPELDLATHAAADVDVLGEDSGRKAELCCVCARDRLGFSVEDLEDCDRAKDLLLDEIGVDVLDLDQRRR
jgi:hypothetical protein